ncbi:MAG: ABC transporter permease [Bacteroidota bacterium]
MINNSLKTGFRSLWKKKSFSFINIMGLAVGIAASLLIFLVIQNEFSYDRYHSKKDRIYRVVSTQLSKSNGEVKSRHGAIPSPLPDAMRQDFPQLEKVAGVWGFGQAQIYIPAKGLEEEKRFKENQGLFWIDPSIFSILDFKWLAGNANGLTNPNTVVLDESLASKFFDNPQAAIGQTIQLWSFRIPLSVVGVFKDVPGNSDIPLKMGGSYATLKNLAPNMFDHPDAWKYVNDNSQCFVLARKGHQSAALQSQLNSFVKKYYKDDPSFQWQLSFQPLQAMHLDKDFGTYKNDALSRKELWSMGLIGIFLLLVACINFINLSTAQSVNRAKEIGVRKVLGGNRPQLMWQFMQETALLTFFSLILGCLLAFAALPMLNDLMHKNLSLDLLNNLMIIFYLLLTGIIVTLLAGIYPALVLSGFNPIHAFRSKVNAKAAGGITLRRGLVVFQFVIAQLLIIGTVVVVKQMKFFQNRPMGFDKDGIALINLPSDSSLKIKYPLLKSRMEALPGVVSASLCMEAPSGYWAWTTDFTFDNDTEKKDFPIAGQFADTSYFKTFGLSLLAGRLPFHSDTTREVVVNEALVKKLGFRSSEEVMGKTLLFNGWSGRVAIVGVIKDYNNKSLREAITPMAITTNYNAYEWIAVRMDRKNMNGTMENVRKLFTGIYPTYMFDPYFFDERIEKFYENEAITAQLFKIFSILAISISCLGLFGLVSFMAVQKTKEVGIRKVLGASAQSIVYLFSKEFTILIGIAFLIAAPLGYYFMQEWLSGFYYHTNIGWLVFAIAIFSSIVIAWITVGYKAIKAAIANPVKSLRTE